MYCRLPVTAKEIRLRLPTGREDLLLCEWRGEETLLALELLDAVTQWRQGEEPEGWRELPVTDLEWALLFLRRALFGDQVRTATVCSRAGCGAKADVSFALSDYLGHFQVPVSPQAERPGDDGWFRLPGSETTFRVPCGKDRAAAALAADPELEVSRRCIAPPNEAQDYMQRVQEYLEAMAPTLSGEMEGRCPECGSPLPCYFDVQRFVLQELRDQAQYIYQDVHLLASRYHWTEGDILDLPRQRRSRYAEAIMGIG